jgi:hypothetical protein
MTNTLYPNESSLCTTSSCRMHCTRKSIRQDSPSLSFEKLSVSCCSVNSTRMPNSSKVLLHQKNAKWKNVMQNFSGGCNTCVWYFQKHSVWLQKPACQLWLQLLGAKNNMCSVKTSDWTPDFCEWLRNNLNMWLQKHATRKKRIT